MARNRKSQYQKTMGGRAWQTARAELKARGDAYCWRGCGTYLLVDAPRGHPQFMTMGHVIALEDGGARYDPDNIRPECGPCNFSDGARRTNKRLGNPHHPREIRQTYSNPEWYEAYQVGKPMVFDPKLDPKPTRPCPTCGHHTTRRVYCSTPCQVEGAARQMRDRYRTAHGLTVDPNKPTTPRTRELSLGVA